VYKHISTRLSVQSRNSRSSSQKETLISAVVQNPGSDSDFILLGTSKCHSFNNVSFDVKAQCQSL